MVEIKELLKRNDYDIYNNSNINVDKIKILADILSNSDSINVSKYLSIENCLNQADQEDDDMWIAGIDILLKRMDIKRRDFQNQKVFEILERIEL